MSDMPITVHHAVAHAVARMHHSTTNSSDPSMLSHSSMPPAGSLEQHSVHSTLPRLPVPEGAMNMRHAPGLLSADNTTTFDMSTKIVLEKPAHPGAIFTPSSIKDNLTRVALRIERYLALPCNLHPACF